MHCRAMPCRRCPRRPARSISRCVWARRSAGSSRTRPALAGRRGRLRSEVAAAWPRESSWTWTWEGRRAGGRRGTEGVPERQAGVRGRGAQARGPRRRHRRAGRGRDVGRGARQAGPGRGGGRIGTAAGRRQGRPGRGRRTLRQAGADRPPDRPPGAPPEAGAAGDGRGPGPGRGRDLGVSPDGARSVLRRRARRSAGAVAELQIGFASRTLPGDGIHVEALRGGCLAFSLPRSPAWPLVADCERRRCFVSSRSPAAAGAPAGRSPPTPPAGLAGTSARPASEGGAGRPQDARQGVRRPRLREESRVHARRRL